MDTTPTTIPCAFRGAWLPRAGLGMVLAASLLGVVFTSLGHGLGQVALFILRWLFVSLLAALAGGLWWQLFILGPAAKALPAGGSAAAELTAAFAQTARRAALPLLLSATTGLAAYVLLPGAGSLSQGLTALLGLVAAVLLWQLAARRGDGGLAERPVLLLALLSLMIIGCLDVLLSHRMRLLELQSLSRSLHLLAFGWWVGGDLWQQLVGTAVITRRPDAVMTALARAMKSRFAFWKRAALGTLAATGLFQGYIAVGLPPLAVILGHPFGWLLTAKIALAIGLLITFTIPLWRRHHRR